MKLHVFGVFAVLLLLVGAVPVNAQSGNRGMSVSVPFGFAVGNVVLPKGEYTFTNAQGAVKLRGLHVSIFTTTMPAEQRGGKNAYELGFHLVNGQYFLASIWMGNDLAGRKLPVSKHERELTAQVGKPELIILTASAR
jgi:hypothetical protein